MPATRPLLAARPRTVIGKAVRHLRAEGMLPAVVYGHGVASESLQIDAKAFDEEAFGVGRVRSWDEGTVEISSSSPRDLLLAFQGAKLSGPYRLRRMRWYPGNRWLFEKLRATPDTPRNGSAA